jgi:asparagine synthase (glutamine-hydrolysing)
VSGFAGVIRIAPDVQSPELDRSAIERMAHAIAFRGPDSLQQTQQPGAWFAFSLLTTGPGTQESSQPCTLNGETWFLGDVRCDGRDAVARKLEQQGTDLPTSASSEHLVLHQFAKFGAAGLPELHGDFSFVLWTPRDRNLIAYRDLTGSRPFFYSHHNGVLLFSNTMQAVLAVPFVSRELDQQFLADFLLGSPYHDPAASVYSGVRRLPPGHLLEFSERGLSIRRIANTPVEGVLILKRDEEYLEEFRRLLQQSVRDQLPGIDTTILLSGGLDSPTVAACAVSLRKQTSPGSDLRLRAFSVDSQPLIDDQETWLASRFAASLNIACQVVHSGDALPFAGWDNLPEPFPEPILDPYSNLYFSYYRQIALNSRVALSGVGGDEVLRLQAWPYLRFLYRQKGPLSALFTLSRYMIAQKRFPPLGAGVRSTFQKLLRRKSQEPQFPSWFTPDFARRLNLAERWRAMNTPAPPWHPFSPRAYAALNNLWVASTLEFFDATWTACHVQLRNPFLDRRLSQFLLRIPPIPWAMDKHLLRRSQIGILPDEIRLRPKTPVTQDVLLLHASSGAWRPTVPNAPSPLLRSLVDWPQVIKPLHQSIDDSLYVHLRPVALAWWMKIIESDGSVRYS